MQDLTDYVTSDDSEPVQRRSSQQRMGSMTIVAHHNTGEHARCSCGHAVHHPSAARAIGACRALPPLL